MAVELRDRGTSILATRNVLSSDNWSNSPLLETPLWMGESFFKQNLLIYK